MRGKISGSEKDILTTGNTEKNQRIRGLALFSAKQKCPLVIK